MQPLAPLACGREAKGAGNDPSGSTNMVASPVELPSPTYQVGIAGEQALAAGRNAPHFGTTNNGRPASVTREGTHTSIISYPWGYCQVLSEGILLLSPRSHHNGPQRGEKRIPLGVPRKRAGGEGKAHALWYNQSRTTKEPQPAAGGR